MPSSLRVDEAAETYVVGMRNMAPRGAGVCRKCHTFVDPGWDLCYPCGHQPSYADVVVPITYSEHLGQVHTALRGYKDGVLDMKMYATPRLAAMLWRFLELHESCIADACGVDEFEIATTVPSSTPERDRRRRNLRWIVGRGCKATARRFEPLLEATGDVPRLSDVLCVRPR